MLIQHRVITKRNAAGKIQSINYTGWRRWWANALYQAKELLFNPFTSIRVCIKILPRCMYTMRQLI